MVSLDEFLDQRPVDVLAFGEPTHDEPAFARARDQIFKRLVTRGFRAAEAPAGLEKASASLEKLTADGPVFIVGHNRDLQRNRGIGAVLSAALNDRYAVIVGSLGSSAALGLGPPAAGTFEGVLCSRVGDGPLFTDKGEGVTRTDVTPQQDYVPLDADTHADAIWHIDLFPPVAAALAERIRELPGVGSQQSGPDLGVPDIAWDDWFFFNGKPGKHPFATIVSHDVPGFDNRSQLDRSGVYRLNLDLGRAEFRRLFGYGPEEFKARRDAIDFSRFDEFVPHPVYGTQSWASIVNPGPRSADHVDRLLNHAYQRARRGA